MSQYVISRYHGHDNSVAIVGEGRIFHFEMERITGQKHSERGFTPSEIEACLVSVGVTWSDIVAAVEPSAACAWSQEWPPERRGWNGVWNRVDEVHSGGIMHIPDAYNQRIGDRPLYRISHHFSHAAYAFLTSPFVDAASMTMDGGGCALSRGGEPGWTTTCTHGSWAVPFQSIHDPTAIDVAHVDLPSPSVGSAWASLALLLTNYINDAGTVMALGTASCDHPLKERIQDLQQVTNRAFQAALSPRPHDKAVLGGGCALNGVASYKLLEDGFVKRLFVPPAVNDGGLTIGAALYGLHVLLGAPRVPYSPDTIAYAGFGETVPLMSAETADQVGCWIAEGRVVGVFQGRAESGPRALGHRSILADPTRADMKDRINAIKGRQSYRPVAPATTLAFAEEHFHLIDPGAYYFMTCIARAKPGIRALIPSALHDDETARIQIVTPGSGLQGVIDTLVSLGRPPCVLNTSFNRKGKAIVGNPDDARQIAMDLGLDALVIGDHAELLR